MTYSNFTSAPPPPLSVAALPGAGRAEFGQATLSAMSMRWSALHDAARLVASLAGLAAEPMRTELRNYPAIIRDAGGWRLNLAEQGVADLAAMMEPGMSALLAAHSRGSDVAVPALALWQEFLSARNALLALCPPVTEGGFRRPI